MKNFCEAQDAMCGRDYNAGALCRVARCHWPSLRGNKKPGCLISETLSWHLNANEREFGNGLCPLKFEIVFEKMTKTEPVSRK